MGLLVFPFPLPNVNCDCVPPLAAFALAAAVVFAGAFAAVFLAGARVFLGAMTSSTESSSSSDTSSNCRQRCTVSIRARELTKACLPFGFAFAFAFDEEAFLAGILEASESRSILLCQLNRTGPK
jgi:hypothetical protein